MNALPGSNGILRFTNDDAFRTAPRGDWWPDDDEDFTDELQDSLRDSSIASLARIDSGNPDIESRAGIALLHGAPWATQAEEEHYVLFIDSSEDGLTVIEYPSRDAASEAFVEHVAERSGTSARYDYVHDPKDPQTAFPTSWPTITWPDSEEAALPRTTIDEDRPPRVELLDESREDNSETYGITRVYNISDSLVRITVVRNTYQRQSYAVAAERAADRTWSTVITSPTDTWFNETPTPVSTNTDSKFASLKPVCDDLLKRTRRILSW